MKHFSFLFALVAASASLFSIAGCDRTPPPPPVIAKPTPEESFALIAETLRRGIEDIQVGFIVSDATGHSRMKGENRVTHKLIPPSDPSEPYRAVITIDSRSLFSMQRNPLPESETSTEETSQENPRATADPNETGVEVLNSDLIQKSAAAAEQKAASPLESVSVSRRTDENERNFDLFYQDGRWHLDPKIKFDAETEQAIHNAFDRALATQR